MQTSQAIALLMGPWGLILAVLIVPPGHGCCGASTVIGAAPSAPPRRRPTPGWPCRRRWRPRPRVISPGSPRRRARDRRRRVAERLAQDAPNAADPAIGVCSRRLAVLLDLFRGMDASFEDVVEGFDRPSQDMLQTAVKHLRDGGAGFQIDLNHTSTGRRIQARGVRAADDQGRTMADVVWMSDVTEGVAAVDTLTQETSVLRRERDLLKAAMDGVAEPIWVRDDDLSLIYCNAAYVKAVDAKDAADVVSRGRELSPRVAVREARALAAAARAAGETRRSAFHMVIDGSRRLMEVTEAAGHRRQRKPAPERGDAPLFSDGSGRLTAGIAYDITRQEELETRLKREAAAHADVLERLGTAIAVFGADTRLIFFNTAFSELWQLAPAWLLEGPNYATVLDTLRAERRLPEVADFPAYKEKELSRFNSLIETMEDVLHLPDGGTLRRVVAPHPMGGLLTTYEDVTDKLALERSYNTLIAVQRETIDNLQEAVAVFGADGQLRLANPAFAGLWELSLDALREGPAMGAVIEAFRGFFDDDTVWARHRGVMLTALEADRQRATQQGRVIRSDGSVLEFVSVPLPDGGVLFCYNDVSAPERVAQALRGRAEALTATDKLRTEFITNVAAELESPVAIAAAPGRSPAQPGAPVPQEILGGRDSQDPDRRRARSLGVEAGQQVPCASIPSTSATSSSVVATMTREAVRRRGIDLSVDCPAHSGWVVGDAVRIKQTLFHLVSGALNAAGERIVSLRVARDGRRRPGRLDVALCRRGRPGSRRQALGIYLAQRMAELHGGALEVETGRHRGGGHLPPAGRAACAPRPSADAPAAPFRCAASRLATEADTDGWARRPRARWPGPATSSRCPDRWARARPPSRAASSPAWTRRRRRKSSARLSPWCRPIRRPPAWFGISISTA